MMFQRKQRGDKDIESLLRAERPEPSSDLVDDLVRRIESEPVAVYARRPTRRLAVAGLVTGAFVAASAAFGVLSDGRDAAAESASSAAKAVRSAVAPAATSSTDQVAVNNKGAQSAAQPAAGSVGTSDATQTAGAPTTAGTATTPLRGMGLTDTSRYLAQLTYEPVTPDSLPAWLCHSEDGNYDNGIDKRLEATTQAEYDALRLAHQNHSFDKGFYLQSNPPNCPLVPPVP